MITRKIGALLKKAAGEKEEFSIDEKVSFEEGPKLHQNVIANFELLKLPHEFNVQMQDLKTSAECTCSRCLKSFSLPIHIPFAEREFLIDLEERDIEEGEDVFYVDLRKSQIVLDDMIRQEVLLHFPEFPLCSEGCKGLCDKCGRELNSGPCGCTPSSSKISPFKFLNINK